MIYQKTKEQYKLESDGRFVIRDYQNQKPFSNFLPGIAGLYGIPMWVFYVNRGQGVVSFGIRNKDSAMLEFFPANKAYQMASSVGFRTFIKYRLADSPQAPMICYEPFRPLAPGASGKQQAMEVSAHEFSVTDEDERSSIRVQVIYHAVANEPVAALMRELSITNGSKKALDIELLDGLPLVNPYGMNEFFIKHMSRTIEAWMITENMAKKAPFFRLRVDASDRPEVEVIREGNFYFSLLESRDGSGELLEPVVDPAKIFGQRTDFNQPDAFFGKNSADMLEEQITENKTPSAFSFASLKIPAGSTVKIRSFFGYAKDTDTLNSFVTRAKRQGFAKDKRSENHQIIEKIQSKMFTVSASPAYDLYCGQTYLDNSLRGGIPVCLTDQENPLVYYVYSRKHGDLERDYNRFLVEPSYLAQGDGNYRDVNQNRRQDAWFEPKLGSANIRTFINLIQLDGFNPLIVKGNEFHFRKSPASTKAVRDFFGAKGASVVMEFLKTPFKLGAFCYYLEEKKLASRSGFSKAIGLVAPFLEPEEKAEHGEGFWVDHWTYNLDLIESYLGLYPEMMGKLLLGDREYVFYDNDHVVQPRSEKYFLHKQNAVRQFKAVSVDIEKKALLAARPSQASWVRTKHGRGEIYRTNLFAKLLCLLINKISSLDPQGVGIEMEAEKPSWYDALNGLPGLLGSSLCETFELKRLAVFLVQMIDDLSLDPASTLALPEELADFILEMDRFLEANLKKKGQSKDLSFWEQATELREGYRARVRLGVSGVEKVFTYKKIRLFLERTREKIQLGIEKSFDPKSGLYPTYFENRVTKFSLLKKKGKAVIKPTAFDQRPLPFFLEGLVHALKVEKDNERRRSLVRAVRESDLYDKKLGMYKVNANLGSASLEVGRARVFKPGWLENESIWIHMEYKWLVELLKAGLAEEYYSDLRKALIPFQPAERYGRSILENSSFIVSSAFSDPSLHGAGFVARLSGSTAEFLNLWLLMNVGRRPFSLGPDKKLVLRFEPCLPLFFFTQQETVRTWIAGDGRSETIRIPKDCFAFIFLGKTLVVYHNPKRMDTFGKNRSWPKKIRISGRKGILAEFEGSVVPDPWARRVRDEEVSRIDIELG